MLNKWLLLMVFLYSFAFSYDFMGSAHFFRKVDVDSTPLDSNPAFLIGKSVGSNTLKRVPVGIISTVVVDSARASGTADVADTALNTPDSVGKAAISDSTKKNAPHGVDSEYVAASNGINTWVNTVLRYSTAYSNLSIGTAPVSNIKFYSFFAPSTTNQYNGYFYTLPNISSTGTVGGYALNAYCYTNLSNGANDSGPYHGIYMRALHIDTGYVGALYGLRFRVGTSGSQASSVGGVAGIEIDPYRQGTGTIKRHADIAIAAPVGSATVDTDYVFYSLHDAPSVFLGGLLSRYGRYGHGADSITIDSSGSLRMYGTATVWDDDKLTPSRFSYIGANNPADISWESGTFDDAIKVFQQNDIGWGEFQFSHGRKSGSDVYIHYHWSAHVR